MKVIFTTSANIEQIKKAVKRLRPKALVIEPDEKLDPLWILTRNQERIPITDYDQSEHFAWFDSDMAGYSLTHKPTGANICYLPSLKILWQLAEALEKVPVNWASSSLEEIGEIINSKRVSETLLFYIGKQSAAGD